MRKLWAFLRSFYGSVRLGTSGVLLILNLYRAVLTATKFGMWSKGSAISASSNSNAGTYARSNLERNQNRVAKANSVAQRPEKLPAKEERS